jgi:hypothetical protein
MAGNFLPCGVWGFRGWRRGMDDVLCWKEDFRGDVESWGAGGANISLNGCRTAGSISDCWTGLSRERLMPYEKTDRGEADVETRRTATLILIPSAAVSERAARRGPAPASPGDGASERARRVPSAAWPWPPWLVFATPGSVPQHCSHPAARPPTRHSVAERSVFVAL